VSTGLLADPWPLPTGQLEPGRTTLFAEMWVVKAPTTPAISRYKPTRS
jgi:hypothetical protein